MRLISSIVKFQPQVIVIHVSNVSAGTELILKMEYYHYWQARSSYGQTLVVEPYTQSLPSVNLTYMVMHLSRSGNYDVSLQYVGGASSTTGLDITVISTILIVLTSLILLLDRLSICSLVRARKSDNNQGSRL